MDPGTSAPPVATPTDNGSDEHGAGEDDTVVSHAALLKLPVDIFKCIADYLDRDTGYCLKRVCRGLSRSEVVNDLVYRQPFRFDDVRDIRRVDWNYRSSGEERWNTFQCSITSSNRFLVQKIALSHWCSIADFQWVEENLPNLRSLDLAAIKDFVWTPDEIWTWKEVIAACPTLFKRLHELEVANWADYQTHSRVEYSYAYSDYRFKIEFRMSRRRDGGSITNTIFPACTQLKTLGIRGCSGCIAWNEWEVHQRVCSLVDGIVNHCPPTLKTLRIHNIAPFLSLFLTQTKVLERLSNIEIGLYSWIEEHRDRDILRHFPIRMIPGTQHRQEEDAFNEHTYEACNRNHMQLGQQVVQGGNESIEYLLRQLSNLINQYSSIKIKPIDIGRDVVLHPLHLVTPHQLRSTGQQVQVQQQQQRGLLSHPDVEAVIRWLAQNCKWKPIIAWDTMMCDVFPENIESPSLTLLPKPEILSRLKTTFQSLKTLNIPIRLSIGDRRLLLYSGSGLDRSVYFPDYKCFVGEGEDRVQIMAPTQARFNLTGIAHLVDELTIQYALDVPGVAGWGKSSRQVTTRMQELLKRETKGWQRFWARYALRLTNLKKLTAIIPNQIFGDWGKSRHLRKLLEDGSWQMLESDFCSPVPGESGFVEGIHIKHSLGKRRHRTQFIQRVFFRLDDRELDLGAPDLTEKELLEENEIAEESCAADSGAGLHRFWSSKGQKRKAEDDAQRGLGSFSLAKRRK
jgi:hypothetical protein